MHLLLPLRSTLTLIILIVLATSDPASAARKKDIPNPDFTKGEPIPEGADKDWTLGATGARGWIYSHRLETRQARQIYITEVAENSPAAGVLEKGDVILGIGDEKFSSDPRVAFGQALTAAESNAGKGNLHLLRWRDGKIAQVTVKLPVLGDYSPTAPYDCPKSKKILEEGCQVLAKRMEQADYKQNPISRSLNALALLASGDETYLPLLKREAEWAANYSVDKFSTWYYGYVMSFLAEYIMATGDQSVMPGLRRIALESANGQSIVGSWGHKFAGKDGRLVGYGMMNAPGVPLTISLELARRAGVDDEIIPVAIERSTKLLRFYIGKGAVPYGDHHPWIQMHEDNGKCGMAAVLFNLLEEEKGSKYFSRMSLASHGNERDTGHTGNFWNMAWAMPGVNQSGPQATGAWMKEFGSWYYDLARDHNGQFRHQGPPQPRGDSTHGWDATGAFLLGYAMPLKQLTITGKYANPDSTLSAAEVEKIIDAGRGWTNGNKHGFYEKLSANELMERLGSWSPIVRERAAVALSRKESSPLDRVMALLDAPALETRLGACQALAQFKEKAAPAVPKLRETLKADDMWLRIKAADALAAIGDAAKPAVPELLKMLAREPGPDDPRAMEQRYLCFALFSKRGGLLSNSLDGVDRKLLNAAIHAGLRNQDGRARADFINVFNNLPPDELKALLPEVHYAVVNPAPSGIMFADQIRLESARILTEWKVAEGIDAIMFYVTNQNHWGSEKRMPVLLERLRSYGVHAKRTIPELEKLAAYFDGGEKGYPKHLSERKAKYVRETVEFLKKTEERPELIEIL
jgi:hypothetical protein